QRAEGLLTQGHLAMNGLSQVSSGAVCRLVAESVRMCGDIRLPAVGTSMVPAIQPGDVLTIQPVDPKEVSRGDIVVYAREEMLVVHRIVRTSPYSSGHNLVTRGDRLMRDDNAILPDELIGRVACIERQHRHVSLQAFSNRVGQALCLVLRHSDRATYLFLRANQLWSGLFYKGST
ncbi:MAG: signal peptidase I, partial [Candidatus Acidiferrum sp.]